MADIEKKVKEILVNMTEVDKSNIKLNTRILEDTGMDSLAGVEFILALEQQFDISIPEEDILKIVTVQDSIDYVKKHAK